MKLNKPTKGKTIFILIWVVSYLVIYTIFPASPYLLIIPYVAFTSLMYFFDVKLKKWGPLHNIDVVGKYESGQKEDASIWSLHQSIVANTLSRCLSISVGVLSFIVGYVIAKEAEYSSWLKTIIILPLFISVTLFAFSLESLSTSLMAKWDKSEIRKYGIFSRWSYIAGWHSYFIFVFALLSLVGNPLCFICILIYTVILAYYYL